MTQATTTIAQPLGWGTTIGLTSQPILPANPTRQGLIFINSSLTTIAICPANVIIGALGVYPTGPAPVGVAAINSPGSITMLPNDKFIIDNIACTCAWNGISGGAGGGITILEHT
jgi:hypothetical protein